MDKGRIRSAAMGGSGKVDGQRRMIAYSLLLVALVVFYIIKGPGSSPRPATVPLAPPQLPKQNEPLAQVERELLVTVADRTRDDRALLEPASFAHLSEQAAKLVYGDLEAFDLERGDWIELTNSADSRRGDALYVIGTLKWMQPMSDSRGYQVRAEIEDEDGRSWNAIFVTEPFDLHPGDVVKAAGFFFKHYDMLRPDRSTSSGPLIVGEELLRSAFRIDPVSQLREDLFMRVRDYDISEAGRPIDSPEFYELLSYVMNVPTEELFPADVDLSNVAPLRLLKHTDLYRGTTLRVEGLLLAAQQVPLGPRGENPLGIPFVWKLWLSSYGGISLVITFESPEEFIEREHVILADGVYFRRYAYENQLGNPKMAAVLIAARIERYVHPTSPISPLLIWIIIGMISIVGVLMWVGAQRDRVSEAAARQKRVARQKKLAGLPGRLSRASATPGLGPRSDKGPAAGTGPSATSGPPGDPA